jgi:hypothetical protein
VKNTKGDENMKSSTFNFTDQDGIEIFVYKWEPDIYLFQDVINWLDSHL